MTAFQMAKTDNNIYQPPFTFIEELVFSRYYRV